jgi:hypothetical protein
MHAVEDATLNQYARECILSPVARYRRVSANLSPTLYNNNKLE